MTSLREQAAALYETARTLTLIHLWNTANAVAAWAYTRDLDRDLEDLHYQENNK